MDGYSEGKKINSIAVPFKYRYCACFSSTYTKMEMTQRRLAYPLCKDNMQYCEALHKKIEREIPSAQNILIFKASKGERQPENADTKMF